MKKYFFITLLCAAQAVVANVVTGVAAIPDGYYDGVNRLSSSDAILDALFNCIKGHNVISYSALEAYYEKTDFYADTVWDMYSTCRFTMADANGGQKAVCDAWNKEHSIPQSWFNEGSPMKSDLFHVYPTDARVNNFRSNLPYGEVAGGNGAGFPDNYQNHGLGKKGSNTFSGYTGTVFEPADEYKGDFARTYFYMVARYRDKALNGSSGSAVFTSNKTNLTSYARNLFLKWHRQDPVSQKEIDRNQAVYGIQHNRNPFIDYPELAEYIWGSRQGQAVDLASMTPTCDGGGYTPVEVVKYGVTWSVNGEETRTDSVAENAKPYALPDKPASCSAESTEFVGWTDAPIDGEQDQAPEKLYKTAKDFPAITGDVTYYAVFAEKTVTESQGVPTQEAFDFTAMGLKDKQVVSSPFRQGDATITFDQAGAGTAPTYYTGAIRLYAGGTMTVAAQQMTKIVLTYGASDKSKAITASVGSFETNTWTGSADEVVFTVGGTNGHRKIATATVTLNGSGTVTTYSRFITSCQTATELTTLPADDATARKVLIGGHIFILVGDRLFTPAGQRVR